MTFAEIEKAFEEGFKISRMMVSPDGTKPFDEKLAERILDKESILFIRDDGWTLLAPSYWEMEAEKLWCDKWVAYIRNGTLFPYLNASK